MKDFLKGLVVATIASAFMFFGAIGVEQTVVSHTLSTSSPVATAAPSYGAFNPTGGGTYYLSSTISSSQTTIKLSSFTEPTSGTPYTMAYLNSSIEYATIAPQTSQSEFISFSGITQNSDGSATLTGVVRGLSRSYPYTASATFALPHAGQSRFILSDAPQVFNSYASLSNTQTFTAVNTFGSTTPPQYDANPVWANFSTQIFADVAYVNSVVAAGAANASETVKGIIQLATGAQAAAGTSSGSTGARLALGNNLATSTPYNSGTNVIPVTGTNEKLSQLFLDLTQSFSLSGLWTFGSGAIFTASSTYNAGTLHVGSQTIPGLYFGGTGVDGALSISSGTTTITLTGAVTEKDYTSISITGTGSLNFTGTTTATGNTVILRSQNACTFTSSSLTMIDLRFMGGGMGAAQNVIQVGTSFSLGGGGGGSTAGAGTTGSGGGAGTNTFGIAGSGGIALPPLASSTRLALAGGNASTGTTGAGGGGGGTGGTGGGGLYIECGGGYTFTTGGFNGSGQTGNSGGSGSSNPGGAGGGGGGGGNIVVDAGSITSDSGTYVVTGGSAGTGGSGTPSGQNGGAGANGSHLEVKNTYFY